MSCQEESQDDRESDVMDEFAERFPSSRTPTSSTSKYMALYLLILFIIQNGTLPTMRSFKIFWIKDRNTCNDETLSNQAYNQQCYS
jgi:hypothetical protein